MARTPTTGKRADDGVLAQLVRKGPYLTDGVRLFRLAGVVSGSSGPKLVQLEDCRTLEVSGCTDDEAMVLGLRPVSPRPAGRCAGERGSGRPPRDDEHGHRAGAHES
jgi:hypothetical protein